MWAKDLISGFKMVLTLIAPDSMLW